MSDWLRTTWGAISTLEYGRALRDYRNCSGPIRVYGTNGPVGWTTEHQSEGPGVIIGRKGAYRGVHYSHGPFWVIDTAYYLLPKVELNLRWAYYALQCQDINSMDSGSAIPSTSRADFYALPVVLPSRPEQNAIASLLGALDDKIAANHSCVRIASQLMSALFQLAMSEGSVAKKIGDVAVVFDGPHATPKKTDAGPWFLSISSLESGRLVLNESAHLGEHDFARWTRRVTPTAGDVLFSYETRLGEAAVMPKGVRACLGRRMALLRSRAGVVGPRTLLQAYLNESFQDVIRQRAVHGATVDRIPLTELPAWPISIPERADELEALLGAVGDAAAERERENETLAELRETLLPKLMSGEIRVRDAEQLVEETL